MLFTIQPSGRAALARAIKDQSVMLAWGAGDPAWDAIQWDDPHAVLPPTDNIFQLVSELGRRKPSIIGFCTPDEQGPIAIPMDEEGAGEDRPVEVTRYRLSDTPTGFLYLRLDYDYEDAARATIREMGVYAFVRPPSKPPGGATVFRAGRPGRSRRAAFVPRSAGSHPVVPHPSANRWKWCSRSKRCRR